MSGRCKDCKHWGTTEQGFRPWRDGFKRCELLETELDQDGEPCTGNAALATPSTFGCVGFVPIPGAIVTYQRLSEGARLRALSLTNEKIMREVSGVRGYLQDGTPIYREDV